MANKPNNRGRHNQEVMVGNVINLDDLPAGSVIEDARYWYFVTELVQKLRQEFKVTDDVLRGYLICAGASIEETSEAVMCFNTSSKLEQMAFELFDLLPHGREGFVIEGVIGMLMVANGYHHSTPDSRGKMGKKMFDTVTTDLVGDEVKAAIIRSIGQNLIQRLINHE